LFVGCADEGGKLKAHRLLDSVFAESLDPLGVLAGGQRALKGGQDGGQVAAEEGGVVEPEAGEDLAAYESIVAGRDVSEAKGESYFARSL
jgi:hypothetical protein